MFDPKVFIWCKFMRRVIDPKSCHFLAPNEVTFEGKKKLVMSLSISLDKFKVLISLQGDKKQAGAELYPKLSKKFKKVRKKCEKHQIFRKLAADSSADASADEVGRINYRKIKHRKIALFSTLCVMFSPPKSIMLRKLDIDQRSSKSQKGK